MSIEQSLEESCAEDTEFVAIKMAIARVEAEAKATIANGVVTLAGTVPEAKYGECFRVVSEVGPAKIDNQLLKGK